MRDTALRDLRHCGLIDLVASFTDLRRLLPGISSNVLTHRLRELDAAGFAVHDTLPLPVACQVYGLGPLTAGLGPALDQLTSWLATVPPSPANHFNDATKGQE